MPGFLDDGFDDDFFGEDIVASDDAHFLKEPDMDPDDYSPSAKPVVKAPSMLDLDEEPKCDPVREAVRLETNAAKGGADAIRAYAAGAKNKYSQHVFTGKQDGHGRGAGSYVALQGPEAIAAYREVGGWFSILPDYRGNTPIYFARQHSKEAEQAVLAAFDWQSDHLVNGKRGIDGTSDASRRERKFLGYVSLAQDWMKPDSQKPKSKRNTSYRAPYRDVRPSSFGAGSSIFNWR